VTGEWQTVSDWLKTFEGQVIEADAQMLIRQRLAWNAFQGSLASVGLKHVSTSLDSASQLGVGEVRIRAWLEPVPNTLRARMARFVRRCLGSTVPPPRTYRLADTRGDVGGRAIEVTLSVRRTKGGTWASNATAGVGLTPEQIDVSRDIA
jgi:hypothetical protein